MDHKHGQPFHALMSDGVQHGLLNVELITSLACLDSVIMSGMYCQETTSTPHQHHT